MKLTIEISDHAFEHAVNKEVGRAIAVMAEEAIKDRMKEILDKKIGRHVRAFVPTMVNYVKEMYLDRPTEGLKP